MRIKKYTEICELYLDSFSFHKAKANSMLRELSSKEK